MPESKESGVVQVEDHIDDDPDRHNDKPNIEPQKHLTFHSFRLARCRRRMRLLRHPDINATLMYSAALVKYFFDSQLMKSK